MPLLQVVEQN